MAMRQDESSSSASSSSLSKAQPQQPSQSISNTTRFLRSINESGVASAILPMQRKRHRSDQIETAYTIQRDAAIRGAVVYTLLGATLTTLSHHLFPTFRSQTLAFKAFIVSGFSMFGLVVGADAVLLRHENHQRSEEELIRGVARRELARQGVMPTEIEIERWKDETRQRLLREREAAQGYAGEDDDTA